MQYGAVLSRAWRIIWRNKIMWLGRWRRRRLKL
jgi:hypothetical protein